MNDLPHMLKSVKFKTDVRCFKKNQLIKFFPGITLLAGDQGCGKSSILSGLTKPQMFKWTVKCDKCQYRYIDTERDNPRVKDPELLPRGLYGFGIRSRFASHGEILLPVLKEMGKYKNELLLVDEPEAGLSIRSQLLILKTLHKAVKNGCQVVVATHSWIIIESIDKVLNLEAMDVQTAAEFLKHQKGKKKK